MSNYTPVSGVMRKRFNFSIYRASEVTIRFNGQFPKNVCDTTHVSGRSLLFSSASLLMSEIVLYLSYGCHVKKKVMTKGKKMNYSEGLLRVCHNSPGK